MSTTTNLRTNKNNHAKKTKKKATTTTTTTSYYDYKVFFYIPNLIGYLRLALMAYAIPYGLSSQPRPLMFFSLYTASASLDLVDGYAARTLQQCSKVGEILDILCDAIGRSVVWIFLAILNYQSNNILMVYMAMTILFLEWIATLAIQCSTLLTSSQHWKDHQQYHQHPRFVQMYFSNNFQNPVGVSGILGMFCYGPIRYLEHFPDDYQWLLQRIFLKGRMVVVAVLVEYWMLMGLLMSCVIQCYFIGRYLCLLAEQQQTDDNDHDDNSKVDDDKDDDDDDIDGKVEDEDDSLEKKQS